MEPDPLIYIFIGGAVVVFLKLGYYLLHKALIKARVSALKEAMLEVDFVLTNTENESVKEAVYSIKKNLNRYIRITERDL